MNYNTGMLSLLWVSVLGWISAAVVNYLADVLPRTRTFSQPACENCGEQKSWITIFWPDRCDQCGRGGTARTWIVFFTGLVVSHILWQYPPDRLGYYLGLLWMTYFGLVAVIDIEHRLILHPVSLVGGAMALIQGMILHGWERTLKGGVLGFLIMLAFYFFGIWFVRIISRHRGEESDEVGLGFGDVNLAGVMGLLLGWPGVLAGLMIAILLGGAASGIYMLGKLLGKRYTPFDSLPYGPFLLLSVVYLLYIAG